MNQVNRTSYHSLVFMTIPWPIFFLNPETKFMWKSLFQSLPVLVWTKEPHLSTQFIIMKINYLILNIIYPPVEPWVTEILW